MLLKVNNRLQLKPIGLEDAPLIFQTIDSQRAYLGEWLPFVAFTKTQQDTEEFIRSISVQYQQPSSIVYTILYDDNFAGLIGFKEIDRSNSRAELGYWLSELYQKNGIATTCTKYLCNHAFNLMGMNRIQIKCATQNVKSQQVPVRLNFALEGVERQGERFSNDRFVDLNVYSRLKCDGNL